METGEREGFYFFLFVRLLRGVSFLDGVLYATCGTKRVRTHVRVAVFGVAGRAHETATLGGSLAATGPHVQRSLAGERRAQPARAVCRVGRLLRNSSWFHRVISTHFSLSLSLSLTWLWSPYFTRRAFFLSSARVANEEERCGSVLIKSLYFDPHWFDSILLGFYRVFLGSRCLI